MKYYPICLDLNGQPALVVGGGEVAAGKVKQLVAAGARVVVVSPALHGELSEMVAGGSIEHRCKTFAAADLADARLVISATDDQAVNEAVAQAAAARGLLCNVVDQPALCSFITPAVVTRGDLQISVSSGGGSPSVTQRVKREIGELIGDEYAALLELAAEMRTEAKRRLPQFEQRRRVLHAFVESEALALLRQGRRAEARQLAQRLLAEFVVPPSGGMVSAGSPSA